MKLKNRSLTLIVLLACLLFCLSLVVTAYPLPNCDRVVLKSYPNRDFDEDGYSNAEELEIAPGFGDLPGGEYDPCDPCKPDSSSVACQRQKQKQQQTPDSEAIFTESDCPSAPCGFSFDGGSFLYSNSTLVCHYSPKSGVDGEATGTLRRFDSIEEARTYIATDPELSYIHSIHEDYQANGVTSALLFFDEYTEDRIIVRTYVLLGIFGYFGYIRHENYVIYARASSDESNALAECVFNALVKDLTALADSKGVPPSSLPPPSGGQAAAAGAAASAAAAAWAILNGLSNAGGSPISRGGGGTGGGTPGPGGIPDWVDPEYEQEQMEWWRQGIEDEKMRLESYMRHRKDDTGFDERVKDMQRSIDYYQEKIEEQQARMQQWEITPGEHRPVNQWDPFSVSDSEKKIRQWDEAWDKFTKMREGAEKRGHWLYSDSEKWDRAMDNIFRDDGEVDYDALNRARTVFKRAIDADIDTMALEHRHWVEEATIQTVRDAKNNPVVRILAAKSSGGTSELVFETLDQLERMHDYVQYHDRGGSDLEAVAGAFKYGVEELAKDKLTVREIRTLTTGKVEMPDGTTRDATTLDSTISLLSLGMKGKDFYSTTVGGEFWDSKAFGIDTNKVRDKGSEMFDNLMGKRQGSSVPETEGVDTRVPGTEAEGGGPIGAWEGSPKQPKIPSEFADDYKAMQRAITSGDETAANRYATRMLARDYDEFQKMVNNGTIDPKIAQRAVWTHQVIVADGVKEGLERTKRVGNLLEDESPVKHVWSPGSAMEPFDPKNPKVPGDTDLTPVVDRKLCSARKIDPDDVQKIASGHTRDAINEIAKKRLGEDVGDYCKATKVKTFEPGTPEEYHSYSSHNTVKGRVINSRGDIVDNVTTLGEECWHGSKDLTETVSNSKTGRAMVAADEHFQIQKTLKELKPNATDAEYVETTRELAKHHGRLEKGANWKTGDIDSSKLRLDELKTPEQKLKGFEETLNEAKTGDPDAIQKAVNDNYGGDYEKFYEDMRQSSKQATQTKLDEGGKIWDAQADRLKGTGVKVDKDNIIKHTVTAPESKEEFLNRLGVTESEPDLRKLVPQDEPSLKTPEAQEAYEKLMRGEQPEGFGPPKNEPRDDVIIRAKDPEVPDNDQIVARQLYERIEELKENDPVLKDLDDRVKKALHDGRTRRIEELIDLHTEEMKSENKRGLPDSKGFQKELGQRLSIDQRIEDPTTVEYQEHRLVQEGVTREQLDEWIRVRQKLRSGEQVEPLKPFKEPEETSWAPLKDGESPFRLDDEPKNLSKKPREK